MRKSSERNSADSLYAGSTRCVGGGHEHNEHDEHSNIAHQQKTEQATRRKSPMETNRSSNTNCISHSHYFKPVHMMAQRGDQTFASPTQNPPIAAAQQRLCRCAEPHTITCGGSYINHISNKFLQNYKASQNFTCNAWQAPHAQLIQQNRPQPSIWTDGRFANSKDI